MPLLEILNLENFKKVLRNIRKVGLVTTVRYITSDLFFDMKYRIDTINTAQLEALEDRLAEQGGRQLLRRDECLHLPEDDLAVELDPSQSTFVDFGSGKGKAMFMAAERGFRKVIGVEFSIELVEVCRENLEIFKTKSKSKTEFEILHMDASEYQIPPEANLLFFSNPFNEELTDKVIGNILKSHDQAPREIWVVHLHPQGNMAFVRHPRFKVQHEAPEGYVLRLSPAD
jgi:16S rRNA G966 N2-methylase RsmD